MKSCVRAQFFNDACLYLMTAHGQASDSILSDALKVGH